MSYNSDVGETFRVKLATYSIFPLLVKLNATRPSKQSKVNELPLYKYSYKSITFPPNCLSAVFFNNNLWNTLHSEMLTSIAFFIN